MSLCTVDQIKQRLGIGDDDAEHDGLLERIAAGVGGVMQGSAGCGRRLEEAEFTEHFNVHERGVIALHAGVWPIVAVDEVRERWAGPLAGGWDEIEELVEDTDFEVVADSGLLLRIGCTWAMGLAAVRAIYTAGYVTPEVSEAGSYELEDGQVLMPEEIVEEAITQCVAEFQRRATPHVSGESAAGGSQTLWTPQGLLPGVRAVLDRYRRPIG